jgi:flagellar hook-associated protein 2
MDEMVTKINTNVSGVTAQKVTDESGNVSLKLTVKSNSNYISISDVSGNALASQLNIITDKEKAAAGTVTASAFSPLDTTSQFSLTARNSGRGYRITSLEDLNGGTALSSLGLNIGSTRPTYVQQDGEDVPGYKYADITTATTLLDSKFTFNGLSLQRDSNTVSDLSSGVSFTLKSVMKSDVEDVTISIASDAASIKSKLSTFIEKYNDLYTYLKQNTSTTAGVRGSLTGNLTASALLRQMSTIAVSPVSGLGSDALKTLSQIGISFDSSGGLNITDTSALEDALTSSSVQVEDLFSSSNGIATSLYNFLNPYLGAGGYIDKSVTSLNTTVSRLADTIKATQDRIDKNASSLRSKYQQLQWQLSNMYTLQSTMSGLLR